MKTITSIFVLIFFSISLSVFSQASLVITTTGTCPNPANYHYKISIIQKARSNCSGPIILQCTEILQNQTLNNTQVNFSNCTIPVDTTIEVFIEKVDNSNSQIVCYGTYPCFAYKPQYNCTINLN